MDPGLPSPGITLLERAEVETDKTQAEYKTNTQRSPRLAKDEMEFYFNIMRPSCTRVVMTVANSLNPAASCLTNICRLAVIVLILKKKSCCDFRPVLPETIPRTQAKTAFDVTV